MKKALFISIFSLFVSVIQAQTITTYSCQAPSVMVDGAKTVWIEDLQVKEAVGWWLTLNQGICGQVKTHITWSTRGGSAGNLFSPWMRTDWYNLAESRNTADIIIGGTIAATRSEDLQETQQVLTAQSVGKGQGKIPYVVRSYNYSRKVNVVVNITVKDKAGNLIKQIDYTGARTSKPTGKGVPPKIASWNNLKLAVMKDVIQAVTGPLLPVLKKRTVFVTKHKFTDKAKRKLYKDVGDFSDIQDIKTACKLFEQEAEISTAAKNAGVLNYLLGNYTKAERYLLQGKHPKATELIAEMKATTELFKKAGITPYPSLY